MEKEVINSLEILGITRISEIINKDINDLHRSKYKEILDSNLSKIEKAKKLNDIYSAKKIVENFKLEDLIEIMEKDIINKAKFEEKTQENLKLDVYKPEMLTKNNANKLSKKLIGKKKIKKSSSKMFKIIVQAEGLRSYEYSFEKSVILPEQIIVRNNFEENIVTYWRDVKTKRWYKKDLQFQEDDYLPYIEEYDKKAKIGSVIYTLVYYNQWISLLAGIICSFTIDFRDYETLRGVYIYVAISWIVPRFFPYFFRYD